MKAGAQAAPHLPSDLLQKILHRLVEARRLGRINDLRGFSAEPEVRSIAGPMSAEGGERTLAHFNVTLDRQLSRLEFNEEGCARLRL